jgi:Leucine-rich repeat (LRR) protein
VEDIGLRNIRDLVAHGFFKKDETEGRVGYTIHDLLHDLALNVTSHECLNVHPSSKTLRKIEPSSIRHLSITLDYTNDDSYNSELRKLSTVLKVGELKSLMIFGFIDESFANTFGDLLGEARALRLLCLTKIFSYILQNFSIYVHLRYLRLAGSTQYLPSTIPRCYHLKILDLQQWYVHDGLPKDMSNLINLRHVLYHTQQDELSSNISDVGKLQFLQELKSFRVKKERNGFELKQLGNLNELRELGIYNLEKIYTKEEAIEAKLIDKKYLHKLTLVWDKERRPNIEHVEEALVLQSLQPHRKLNELCIIGHRGPSCPTWLGGHIFEALQSLHLDGVAWEVFPPLGRMRLLQELTLENVSTVKELNLTQIQWFPYLQVLKIKNCPKLKQLPPIPWTQTLCCVMVIDVGSMLPYNLQYSKSSSNVYLRITGKDDLHILDEQILDFNNLIDLKELYVSCCPPLELKHLQMLASLVSLDFRGSSFSIEPSGGEGEVKWQLPVEVLLIESCDANGKELTELISHFPKLRSFYMVHCKKITQVGVMLEEQEEASNRWSPSCSNVTMDDVRAVCQEDEDKLYDGLLIFPAHVRESLRDLSIDGCPELSPVPFPILNYKTGGVCRGGLQALHHLESLCIWCCPKFLSAYKALFSSSCRPFPSSLKYLTLLDVEGTGTLEPLLSNLTSLIYFVIILCGDDWRSNGLWTLVTHGQLSSLQVKDTPKFFVGSDPMRELKDEYQEQLLHSSSKLEYLETDDDAILAAPICSILSSSLVWLKMELAVERFTKEQEDALQLLTSLQKLQFWGCSKLQCLPAGLHRLPNLKRLSISFCPAISSLPENGLPSSLEYLSINWCNEELKQQCIEFVQSHPQIKLDSN